MKEAGGSAQRTEAGAGAAAWATVGCWEAAWATVGCCSSAACSSQSAGKRSSTLTSASSRALPMDPESLMLDSSSLACGEPACSWMPLSDICVHTQGNLSEELLPLGVQGPS